MRTWNQKRMLSGGKLYEFRFQNSMLLSRLGHVYKNISYVEPLKIGVIKDHPEDLATNILKVI